MSRKKIQKGQQSRCCGCASFWIDLSWIFMRCFQAMPWHLHLTKTRMPKPRGTQIAPTRNTGRRDWKMHSHLRQSYKSHRFPLWLASSSYAIVISNGLRCQNDPSISHLQGAVPNFEGIFIPHGAWPLVLPSCSMATPGKKTLEEPWKPLKIENLNNQP